MDMMIKKAFDFIGHNRLALLAATSILLIPLFSNNEISLNASVDAHGEDGPQGELINKRREDSAEWRPALQVGDRDPFVLEKVSSSDAVKPPVMAPSIPPTPPQAVIEVPQLNLQYIGRINAPDGGDSVYVSVENNPMRLALGMDLPNGYRVSQMTENFIEFTNLSMQKTTRLEIPPAPGFEVR